MPLICQLRLQPQGAAFGLVFNLVKLFKFLIDNGSLCYAVAAVPLGPLWVNTVLPLNVSKSLVLINKRVSGSFPKSYLKSWVIIFTWAGCEY